MKSLPELISAARNVHAQITQLFGQAAALKAEAALYTPIPIGALADTVYGTAFVVEEVRVLLREGRGFFELTGPMIQKDGNTHPTNRGRQLIPIEDLADER